MHIPICEQEATMESVGEAMAKLKTITDKLEKIVNKFKS